MKIPSNLRPGDHAAAQDRRERQAAKVDLLKDVCNWLDEDVERGKIELQRSAKSVIDDLLAIANQL